MNIVLDITPGTADIEQFEKYTPEQQNFIMRHVFGYLATIFENGGLGDLITPEIDWDNQEEAERLFGDDETDESMVAHMDAAGMVIGFLDNLYDAAIEQVQNRGWHYVSMYQGGWHGEPIPERSPEEMNEEGDVVIPTAPVPSLHECGLCGQSLEDGVYPVINGEIYHEDCGEAMKRSVEETTH